MLNRNECFSPMSPGVNGYTWHPQQKWWRYAFAAGAVAFAVIVWLATRSEPEVWPRVLASSFALVALFPLIEQNTRVDARARIIVREGRLFGCFRVWLWRDHLSEFTGVGMSRQSDSEGGYDTVLVGLSRRSGRLMAVSYFHAVAGQPSVEAEQVARSLADTTGLQLHEDVPTHGPGR
jgi:drug/metabolite transporter superfamily protein YnfA